MRGSLALRYGALVTSHAAGGPTLYRRARSDLKAALAELAERGTALATARYVRTSRGSLIRAARQVRADSIDVVTYAVLAERSAGSTWTEIAHALGLEERFVREHYEPIEAQWRDGEGVGPVVQRYDGGQPLRVINGG